MDDVPEGFLERCVIDWQGIDVEFTELLSKVVLPEEGFSMEDDRSRRRKNSELGLRAIVEMVLTETTKLLEQGNLEEALFGAHRGLKYAEDLFGNQSPELIPSYLLVAKASYSLKKYKKSEQFLALANWGILKAEVPEAKNENISVNLLKAELNLYFGLLYASTNRLTEAVRSLSEHIYYRSLEFGPLGLPTAMSYLHLGNVFGLAGKQEEAIACYGKVEKIWGDYFKRSEEKEDEGVNPGDAIRCLSRVLEVKVQKHGEDDMRTAETERLLGIAFENAGEVEKAREHYHSALGVMEPALGSQHVTVVALKEALVSS